MIQSNLMLDLETLGTKPGCVVLSIAAVPFNMPFNMPYDLEPFYKKISVESSVARDLVIDPATVAWWNKQNREVYAEATSGTDGIALVLNEFSDYCNTMPTAPKIWGNGSDFDNPILAAAFESCSIKVPWTFRDNMCYRTLKNLFKFMPYTPPEIAHNALSDAKAQAAHAQKIFTWMVSKGMVSENVS